MFLDGIFNLQQQDALFLFELYCENIQITTKLKPLFKLRNHIRHFSLKVPIFFEAETSLNQRVEQYIASLKQGSVKAPEKKSSKPKFATNLEIDVEAEAEPGLTLKPPSLQDLSNVLVQITTPNFKSIQKKELFKPPVLNGRENNTMSPKMKVFSPNAQHREGFKLIAETHGGSIKGLSTFNPFMAKENYLKANSDEAGSEAKSQNPFFKSIKEEQKSGETVTSSESASEGIVPVRQMSS